MRTSERDLIEAGRPAPLETRSGLWVGLERALGGSLIAAAGLGLLVWLMFLLDVVLRGSGVSVEVGGFPVPGLLGMLLLTPVILALVGTQGLLGIGLFNQRGWVGWFGLLYVIGGILGAGLIKILPAGLLASMAAALLGTLPTWVFVARRARGDLESSEGR